MLYTNCISSDKESSLEAHYSSFQIQIQSKIVLLMGIFALFTLFNCQGVASNGPKPEPIPSNAFNDDGSINAYIEIPAGTNVKYELDKSTKDIKADKIDGKTRVIDFLPYPGNYGFIAGTHMDQDKGGDGDALDVLVLSDAAPRGSVIKVLPIGVILLEDQGENDHKIIAVPFEASERIINVEKFSSFITKYNAAQFIVQEWFLNYKGLGKMKLLGWKDETFAAKEIRKWSVKEN